LLDSLLQEIKMDLVVTAHIWFRDMEIIIQLRIF